MKLINFKTFEDQYGITPAQLYLAANQELLCKSLDDADENDESYVFMVNPDFDTGFEKNGKKVFGCRAICIFPQKSHEDGHKYYVGYYMDGWKSERRYIGDLGSVIAFGELFGKEDDLTTLLKKAKACYGAKNNEELNQRLQNFGKTSNIHEK